MRRRQCNNQEEASGPSCNLFSMEAHLALCSRTSMNCAWRKGGGMDAHSSTCVRAAATSIGRWQASSAFPHASARLHTPPHASARLRTPPHASARPPRTPPRAPARLRTRPHPSAPLRTPPLPSAPLNPLLNCSAWPPSRTSTNDI
eukprot:249536-Prymnesium_polylepis.1